MEKNYLSLLNPEQKTAVMHTGSPLLILAGAGSGKTRVITAKIAYLIQEKNILPSSILAVTFTKKAALEMKERACGIEPRAADSQIRTFHSFGAYFLRRYAKEAGLASSFTVYDDGDSASLIRNAIPSLTQKQAYYAAAKIALAKDYCLEPEDDLGFIDSSGDIENIYAAYEKRLRASGNADFGDLIMKPLKVMQEYPSIRMQMYYRFKVIMVDEYQDSNKAQFMLLKSLSGIHEDSGNYVCAVGDDDQSIYKFRGADVQNILNFPKFFLQTHIIRLERNYRSTENILKAANAVVQNNKDRLGKNLRAERKGGKVPVLTFLENQDEEAAFCASLIEKSCADKNAPCNYSDWAILYRTNAQSLGLETEFLHRKIPYIVAGSLKFYEREEIKDTLAYISLIVNPRDEVAFKRAVNKPARGIGKKALEKIESLSSFNTNLEETDEDSFVDFMEACSKAVKDLSKKASAGVKSFFSLINNLRQSIENPKEQLSFFIQKLIEYSGLLEYHQYQDEIDGTSRVANMQELVNSAVLYPCSQSGLLDFLDSIELDRFLAEEDIGEKNNAVTLITLHNTKGLEFNKVIITGLENGIFPRYEKTGDELEEERRLFYVGITRAKDELFITSCRQRRLYGRTENMAPSKFLAEAEQTFEIIAKNNSPLYKGGDAYNSKERIELMEKWKCGTRLYHSSYGYGQIIFCKIVGNEFVINVLFETGLQKKFMPEYQSGKFDIIKE